VFDGIRLHRDVTPAEQRAAWFGKVGVAFGAGFILGPAVGGLLGGWIRVPSGRGGLSFANTPLRPVDPAGNRCRRSALAVPLEKRESAGRTCICWLRPGARGLSVVNFLAQVAHVVLPLPSCLCDLSIWLDTTTVGLNWPCRHLLNSSAGVPAIGPMVQRFGERRALRLALAAARWLSDLRRGADWPAVLARHTRDGVMGRRRRGRHQALTTQLSRRTAGPAQGATIA